MTTTHTTPHHTHPRRSRSISRSFLLRLRVSCLRTSLGSGFLLKKLSIPQERHRNFRRARKPTLREIKSQQPRFCASPQYPRCLRRLPSVSQTQGKVHRKPQRKRKQYQRERGAGRRALIASAQNHDGVTPQASQELSHTGWGSNSPPVGRPSHGKRFNWNGKTQWPQW